MLLGGAAVREGNASGPATSGRVITTGPQKGTAAVVVRRLLVCPPGYLLDGVSLSIRYAPSDAAPLPANYTPATAAVSINNIDTRPMATLGAPVPLDAAFTAQPASGRYSAPLLLAGRGLRVACDAALGIEPRGGLRVHLTIVNNDRPVAIPLDDLAGGFNLTVDWVRSASD